MFPLKDYNLAIPATHEGSFGKVRRHDIHTGVDLYIPEGSTVYAIEDGTVVTVEDFTGVEDSGPDSKYRYLYTQVVMVKGNSGVIAYGEVKPNVKEGDEIKEGDVVGHIMNVLPEDYEDHAPSRSMLHFELYDSSATETTWWKKSEAQPENLKDPTDLLRKLFRNKRQEAIDKAIKEAEDLGAYEISEHLTSEIDLDDEEKK
jgi:murein DD-endopeptidase MepM/ murein hydrolase activator NlpD